jgi:hypothetical protein
VGLAVEKKKTVNSGQKISLGYWWPIAAGVESTACFSMTIGDDD